LDGRDALGACALRRGRFALGGGLRTYASLIRAFPALAVATLLLPGLSWRTNTGSLPVGCRRGASS
jgi:hypothetical protein